MPDGHAAISAWQNGGYDLILTDCHMPHLDGYEATREIRRLEHSDTAHAMAGADTECRAAGRDDFFPSPSIITRYKVVSIGISRGRGLNRIRKCVLVTRDSAVSLCAESSDIVN